VRGANLVTKAVAALRAAGWSGPQVAIDVDKRIPVAAGLGGGSADAAAALRLAGALAQVPVSLAAEVAVALGADVPSQVEPGVAIGRGAGELIEPVSPLASHAFLILPQPYPLATAQVYREADRLGLGRTPDELRRAAGALSDALGPGTELPGSLLVNDLQSAAVSLRPRIEGALDAARYAGAEHVMVSGSGPTALGLFWGADAMARAAAGAAALAGRYPGATTAVPVDASFGAPQPA
jgi:4-diphosphocytidyl-2-C-methyl-D-erythritol kinase